MAKNEAEQDDDGVATDGDKWYYIFRMFAIFCVCAVIGSCCVAYEYRMIKEAEFKAKERQ